MAAGGVHQRRMRAKALQQLTEIDADRRRRPRERLAARPVEIAEGDLAHADFRRLRACRPPIDPVPTTTAERRGAHARTSARGGSSDAARLAPRADDRRYLASMRLCSPCMERVRDHGERLPTTAIVRSTSPPMRARQDRRAEQDAPLHALLEQATHVAAGDAAPIVEFEVAARRRAANAHLDARRRDLRATAGHPALAHRPHVLDDRLALDGTSTARAAASASASPP
jgi:hypothetical protein